MNRIKTEITIPAMDEYQLGAPLFEPCHGAKAVVQFNAGIGVTQRFYLPFVEYLADKGFGVVIFDYRGIGRSRPEKLKGFQASISDWGRLDMTGVWEWVVGRFPDQPKYIMAHSMGGQIIGLMENHHHLKGIISIASTMGNWRNYSGSYKYYAAILWSVFFPVTSSLLGYVPLGSIRMGEDLPKGVADEWHDWCKGNVSHTAYLERHGDRHSYYSVNVPYKIFYIENDVLATAKTIPHVRQDYRNAQLDIEMIKARDIGTGNIGHLGFFSKRHKETLWTKPLSVLNQWSREHSASQVDSKSVLVSSFKLGGTGKTGDRTIHPQLKEGVSREIPDTDDKNNGA